MLNVAEELEEIVKHDGVENVRMVVHDFTPEGMDQYSVFEEAFVLIGMHPSPPSPLSSDF